MKISELEYQTARELSEDAGTSPADSADLWQVCRWYRGQIFDREQAERALHKLRGTKVPA